MWPFSKKKIEPARFHVDYASDPDFSASEEVAIKEAIVPMEKVEPCCGRFVEAVKEKEIVYSYSESNDMDETAWFISGFWHLYFCPFCGKNIKGPGFGVYDEQTSKTF